MMMTIHFILVITTGLLALSTAGAWFFIREKKNRGADDRAWACIDLPSPDTPRTLAARCRARLQAARLGYAPAALAVAFLLLTVAAGMSAWVC